MDFDKLLARIKGILLQPARAWPQIAAESDTPASLYKRYILILAALPPVFQFIKVSLIGEHTLGMYLRGSVVGGLWAMVVGYAVSLLTVLVMAHILNALAPTFEGRKNLMQALKTIAYASTAVWVASFGMIVPWLGWAIALAGMAYSIYLLYLGLPHTMQCPPEKSMGYTAISALLAVLLSWLLAALLGAITGAGTLTGRLHHDGVEHARADVSAAMAKLKHAREGSHRDGATTAATPTTGSQPSPARSADHVKALSPARIRAMLPQQVGHFARASARASRQDVMNTQMSQALGTYRGPNGQQFELSIIDTGGASALLNLGGTAAGDVESITDNGFEKVHHDGDRVIRESWNSKDETGQYNIVLAHRYAVRAKGKVKDFDALKDAVHAVDLDALEKLKDEGAAQD